MRISAASASACTPPAAKPISCNTGTSTVDRGGFSWVCTARSLPSRLASTRRAFCRRSRKASIRPDPADARKSFRNAPDVADLLDRYVADHVRKRNKPSVRAELERVVERYIRPALGSLKVAAVTRGDVEKLHRSLVETPRQTNVVRAICSKVFNLAEEWEYRPEGTNPCRKIARYSEHHRERFLSADELGRLGAVLRQAESEGLPWKINAEGKATAKHLPAERHRRTIYPRVVTAAVELLLFTGCRLSEVLGMRWEHIDLTAGTIVLPDTKAGRPQTVAINAPARQVLLALGPTTLRRILGCFQTARERSRPFRKKAKCGARPAGGADLPTDH